MAVGSGTVNTTRHALPSRDIAPKFAIAGLMLLGLGLALAFVIASNIGAANARDLPSNIWFFDLGRVHPEIHSTADGFSWFADGVRNIVVVPVVTVVLLACRQWRWAVFLVVSSQVGLLISNALKFSIARQRPPLIESTDFQLHLSFPSGHTLSGLTVWVAMAMIAWYLLPRPFGDIATVALVVIGLANGPSRLILGKHWLTDVLGAWMVAGGWLMLVWAGFLWFLRPRMTG